MTLALEALLAADGEAILRATMRAALNGDAAAQRTLLDRLLPRRRERPVQVALPPVRTAADAAKAMAVVIDATATGELTVAEAEGLGRLIEGFASVLEAQELERRLAALEERMGRTR